AMKEDAQVKNYHMEITQGGQTLAGMFTGNVTTKVAQWMLTVPAQAVWRINKVNLKFGPYFSLVLGQEFSGWAHQGYLRVDDPTGAKVELGEAENERGNYDFTEHLRRAQFGMTLGADWALGNRLGLYADLNWGMTAAFHSDFHTIEQSLYPIYGQLGITYRIR
ncbi:MAG: PorT family protein, partial [Muribaculaceae bacterium]|nr:PorT family protein [Muribaculaceae bacterium]